MKLCLVSPPTVTDFDLDSPESAASVKLAEHAPVGVLSLAAVLERMGSRPELVELNLLYLDYLRSGLGGRGVDFCSHALDELLRREFDVIGFGTICSSYPLTLRIVEAVRRARPEVSILLGGPQASVVDLATLQRFPAVDVVVRGEAEETLPRLLAALGGECDLSAISGISFRRAGQPLRNREAPLLADLDLLPLPAYERYAPLRAASCLPLELGRGCPYGCTFCSTNDFFRRTFRLKSAEVVVEQMLQLKAEYGLDRFELIHDMFTVDRRKVVELCEALRACGEPLFWNCSARTDRVDEALLQEMAEAGCRGIFFGIETGSASLQKTVKKNLDLEAAMDRIEIASGHGMRVAVSLITGFPDETEDDLRATVGFFADSLRFDNAIPQLHVLAPLAGTPIERDFRDRLTFDEILSDMTHQGWEQAPEDRALVAEHVDVFPNFYAVPTPLSRPFLEEMRRFLLAGSGDFRWLLVALSLDSGDLVTLFRAFEEWRRRSHERSDHEGAALRGQLARFIREQILPSSAAAPALSSLLTLATGFEDLEVGQSKPAGNGDGDGAGDDAVGDEPPGLGDIPRLAQGVRLVAIDVDYAALRQCLVEKGRLDAVAPERHTLASRRGNNGVPEVVQLSELSAALLERCDGSETVESIARAVAESDVDTGGIASELACRLALGILRSRGFLTWRSG